VPEVPKRAKESERRRAPFQACFNSQTPLVQFLAAPDGSPGPEWGSSVELSELREGIDYRFSPGGVTRMVYPLVRKLVEERLLTDAHWVSLNPVGPKTVRTPGLTIHNVALPPARLGGYGKAKEAIWSTVHGLEMADDASDLFWTEEFAEYAFYNRLTSEKIRDLDAREDFDLFYIHDFQQLPVGEMIGSLKPKIFRWHIPFDARRIPENWRAILVQYLSAYDVVVVSCERYRRGLRALGFEGDVRLLYPYIDPAEYTHPSRAEAAEAAEALGIRPNDRVVLVVARMDPAKAQDRAIRAVASVLPDHPRLRLVLVGNGSFSSSRGGVGLSKSDRWRAHLEDEAKRAGVSGRVIFTGHVPQRTLDCLYERCEFTVLPSVNEGFGLVVVESWLHGRPAIVTERAGVAELMEDGVNGLLFDPDDPLALPAQMERLLGARRGFATSLARRAAQPARQCEIDTAAKAEGELIADVLEG
jgi:glycosyltransferase involved in cell wall biosynthesis